MCIASDRNASWCVSSIGNYLCGSGDSDFGEEEGKSKVGGERGHRPASERSPETGPHTQTRQRPKLSKWRSNTAPEGRLSSAPGRRQSLRPSRRSGAPSKRAPVVQPRGQHKNPSGSRGVQALVGDRTEPQARRAKNLSTAQLHSPSLLTRECPEDRNWGATRALHGKSSHASVVGPSPRSMRSAAGAHFARCRIFRRLRFRRR